VKVINVSNPAAPFLARIIQTTSQGSVHKTTVIGKRLYTSNWDSGTDIYDITDIATRDPVLLVRLRRARGRTAPGPRRTGGIW